MARSLSPMAVYMDLAVYGDNQSSIAVAAYGPTKVVAEAELMAIVVTEDLTKRALFGRNSLTRIQ